MHAIALPVKDGIKVTTRNDPVPKRRRASRAAVPSPANLPDAGKAEAELPLRVQPGNTSPVRRVIPLLTLTFGVALVITLLRAESPSVALASSATLTVALTLTNTVPKLRDTLSTLTHPRVPINYFLAMLVIASSAIGYYHQERNASALRSSLEKTTGELASARNEQAELQRALAKSTADLSNQLRELSRYLDVRTEKVVDQLRETIDSLRIGLGGPEVRSSGGSSNPSPTRAWISPEAPILTAPRDWYVATDQAPTLQWATKFIPGGRPVVAYKVVIYLPGGEPYYETPWMSETSYRPVNLSYRSYAWAVRARDDTGQISEESVRWRFGIDSGTVSLGNVSFVQNRTNPDLTMISACATGSDSAWLSVSVNSANDGSSSGQWTVLMQVGAPCITTSWYTAGLAAGNYLVRIEAYVNREHGTERAATLDRLFYLTSLNDRIKQGQVPQPDDDDASQQGGNPPPQITPAQRNVNPPPVAPPPTRVP